MVLKILKFFLKTDLELVPVRTKYTLFLKTKDLLWKAGCSNIKSWNSEGLTTGIIFTIKNRFLHTHNTYTSTCIWMGRTFRKKKKAKTQPPKKPFANMWTISWKIKHTENNHAKTIISLLSWKGWPQGSPSTTQMNGLHRDQTHNLGVPSTMPKPTKVILNSFARQDLYSHIFTNQQ